MNLSEFEYQLNQFLKPGLFHDFCPDGLIVQAPDTKQTDIHKVVTGVSLRESLIEEAVKKNADVIIVHHPNGWWVSDKDKKIIDSNFARYTRMLIKNGISLFGYHLPLDAHPEIGNNVTVLKRMFGLCIAGCASRFLQDDIAYGLNGHVVTDEMLDEAFPKGYQAFNFESGKEYKVAVCTGSASLEIDEVYAQGYNMFITGEVRESTPIFAQEHNMAVIAAGHHRTEIFCVQNLAKWINAKCDGVSAEFVDIDNPV